MTQQAVILLGGKGTRIQSLYSDRPKCLVPVAGKPILLHQLEWLQKNGITRIHLAAGFMADVLQDWLKQNVPENLSITVSTEPAPLGTGGAIKFVESWIQTDPFFVLNGDSLTPNLDFKLFADTHENNPAAVVTLAVTQIEKTGRYGTVEFNEENRVTAFLEKADRDNGWINAGVYCINHSLLNLIESGKNVSIETDIFPELGLKNKLYTQPANPPMLDMGTPDGLKAMKDFFAKPAALDSH